MSDESTNPDQSSEVGVRIPFDQLPEHTLRSVIEEFVTRDGTELTESSSKIDQVKELLRSGDVELWFDPVTQSCNILRA